MNPTQTDATATDSPHGSPDTHRRYATTATQQTTAATAAYTHRRDIPADYPRRDTTVPTDPAREIARAVDRLTTQVRRLADTMATPTDDGPTTPDPGPDPAGHEFRDALLVLLSRAARGVLTPDEGPLLRQHVEHLLRERDQLAASAAAISTEGPHR
ncbi:hypothetical protein CP973_07030 [Streptomyces albofaciens JCM 4342]|uniref:hypothetical protein n=1 Tax=Streptomyces albofaciens TaxID=66866 RepID=UPI001239BF12|nr:hypothetical protein [Streptomyces albofaciens]KAA6221750.1 hypothetical protein CP973_07030 [Streptomyces albofaciens JCM 4342]